MESILNKFIVNGVPYSYWKIRNHEDMREWLLKTLKYRLPSEFLDLLVEKEMENLVAFKMQNLKIKSQVV